ncbi:MAG: flagellar biosynthesis anti-sigma factor FlgM [Terriglobales bacterium]
MSERITKAKSSPLTSGSGATVSTGDQTTLGSSAVELTATAMAQPDTRTDLVQKLRSQIADGSYAVDPAQVADAMLADPQALGPRGNG